MRIIKVEISWTSKNYCCGYGLKGVGAIFCTNKNIEDLKTEFAETLRFHVETMAETGEMIPPWLLSGEYTIEYTLSVSGILHQAMLYTTMATISHATDINQCRLNEYASSAKKPRRAHRDKIIHGLHDIGQRLFAIN